MKVKKTLKMIVVLVVMTIMTALSITAYAETKELQLGVETTTSQSYNFYTIDVPYKGYITLNYYSTAVGGGAANGSDLRLLDENGDDVHIDSFETTVGSGRTWYGTIFAFLPNDLLNYAKGYVNYYISKPGTYYIEYELVTEGTPSTSSLQVLHGHDYKEEIAKNSTCTETGIIKYICDCGDTLTYDLPKEDHTIVTDYGEDATCEKEGLTNGSHCSVCGTVITEQEIIKKLEHNYQEYKETIKEATCTEEGIAEVACIYCHKATKEIIIDKAEHSIITIDAIPATCSSEGKTEGQKCKNCDYVKVKQKSTPKTEHKIITTEAVEPTCSKEGKTEGKKCEYCDYVEVKPQAIPKTEHNLVTIEAVKPTCVKTGKTEEIHCADCDYKEKEASVLSVVDEHNLKHIEAKEATQDKEATIEHWQCSDCAKLFADENGKLQIDDITYKGNSIVVILIIIGGALIVIGIVLVVVLHNRKKSKS